MSKITLKKGGLRKEKRKRQIASTKMAGEAGPQGKGCSQRVGEWCRNSIHSSLKQGEVEQRGATSDALWNEGGGTAFHLPVWEGMP